MDESKYFKLLWRVNAVLLLLVLLGIAGDSIYYTLRRWFRPIDPVASNVGQVGVNLRGETVVKEKWLYGDPAGVPGGAGFIVPLYSTWSADEPSRRWKSLRNLLFLDADLKAPKWLMPDNERHISHWEFLDRGDGDATPGILLKMWEEHPDADKEAGGTSKLSIFLARPDCTGFVRVLDGLKRLIGSEFVDEKHLVLFYVKGGAGHAAKIALADFSVVETAKLDLQE